jgi:PhnB protein
MPKRSLSGGPEVNRLNRAVDEILQRADTSSTIRARKSDPDLAALVRVATALRNLPREEFKETLKSNLERSVSMATTTMQAPPASRTFAAPRLIYKSAAKAIAFYEKAFGAKESWRFENEGGIGHAEIMIGDTVIMLGEEWPEGGRFSAETWGHSPVNMRIQVPDVEAFVEHAVDAGAKLVSPPADQFYGYRDATLADPFGYTWSVSTVKEEMSVEEMQRRFRAIMPPKKKPKVDPVPKGYRTVTPYLVAQDAEGLIDFVKETFGADEKFRSVGSAGGYHCEVQIGDSMMMIGGGIRGREFRGTPATHGLHIYVEECDAVYAKALEAGAASLSEPQDHFYGERSGGVKDAYGNHWYIATHRGKSHIPESMHTVNCGVQPLRAEPVISFLKRAFGAQELSKHASPDGVIHHATVLIGDSVFEMGEAHGPYQPMPSMFYLYVPDCDALYHRALAAGATSISELQDHPYGDRSGGVKDAFGNQWYIATHIKDVAP